MVSGEKRACQVQGEGSIRGGDWGSIQLDWEEVTPVTVQGFNQEKQGFLDR
jgi:hypothetical protein